jgi:hypothetical protein
METCFVFCKVRTEFVNIILTSFSFRGLVILDIKGSSTLDSFLYSRFTLLIWCDFMCDNHDSFIRWWHRHTCTGQKSIYKGAWFCGREYKVCNKACQKPVMIAYFIQSTKYESTWIRFYLAVCCATKRVKYRFAKSDMREVVIRLALTCVLDVSEWLSNHCDLYRSYFERLLSLTCVATVWKKQFAVKFFQIPYHSDFISLF